MTGRSHRRTLCLVTVRHPLQGAEPILRCDDTKRGGGRCHVRSWMVWLTALRLCCTNSPFIETCLHLLKRPHSNSSFSQVPFQVPFLIKITRIKKYVEAKNFHNLHLMAGNPEIRASTAQSSRPRGILDLILALWCGSDTPTEADEQTPLIRASVVLAAVSDHCL